MPKARHIDITDAWRTLRAQSSASKGTTPEIQRYKARFAVTSGVNGAGLPGWPRCGGVDAQMLDSNLTGIVPVGYNVANKRWEGLADTWVIELGGNLAKIPEIGRHEVVERT